MTTPSTDNVVTIAVFRRAAAGPQVLLVKRGIGQAKGQWALPSGHINLNESPYRAATRELAEETSIRTSDLVYVTTKPSAHGPNDVLYGTEVPHTTQVHPASDAAGAAWAPLRHLPKLAFNHQEAVFLAYAKLYGSNPAMEAFLGKRLNQTLVESQESGNGTLIVFEGCDGAGKSTQANKLADWLEKNYGYAVTRTKWNSSPLLSSVIDQAKRDRVFTPLLYSLLHASDMLHRYHTVIAPALEQNQIVVSDRYVYTSMVRDDVRGVDRQILDLIYRDFRHPDIIVYCEVPPEISYERLREGKDVGFYSSGMDLGYSKDKWESLHRYITEMHRRYQQILPYQQGFCRVDGTQSVKDVFKAVKKSVVALCRLGSIDEHLDPGEISDLISEDFHY